MTGSVDTDRFRLDPLRVDDAEEMAAVLGDPALYVFTGGEPPTVEALRTRYAKQVAGPAPGGDESWHNWVIRDRVTRRALGFVQATVVGDRADVAWVVGTGDQGRGVAREAAAVMAAWLRDHGVITLVASVHPDHLASTAVARGLGLVATGRVDDDGEVEWRRPAVEPAVDVRCATPADTARLLPFWAVAAEDAHRPADTSEAVSRLLDRDPGALLVATVGDVLVGTVVAGFDGWRCHLYRLAVHPSWRRRGIARALVEAAEQRFGALGATRVDAMVLDENRDGQALWGGLGYARQAQWARWVKPL